MCGAPVTWCSTTSARRAPGTRSVLARGQRLLLGIGQLDLPGLQESSNALAPRPAVHQGAVFGLGIELMVRLAFARLPPQQAVKNFLPGSGMEASRVRDHAVHVEDRDGESVSGWHGLAHTMTPRSLLQR